MAGRICIYTHVHSDYTIIFITKNKWKRQKIPLMLQGARSFHFQLDNPCTSKLHCEEILCACYLFLCGTISLELHTPLVNRIQHRSEQESKHKTPAEMTQKS